MEIQYLQLLGKTVEILGDNKPFLMRHIHTKKFYSDTRFNFDTNTFIPTNLYCDLVLNGCEGVDYKKLTFNNFLATIKNSGGDYSPLQYYSSLAKIICEEAHDKQFDKAGEPYYLHPCAVADNLVKAGITDPIYLSVAYLHDILEDTTITAQNLQEFGFTKDTITAIKLLTHNKSEDYQEYLEKIATNPIALTIKKFDILQELKDKL